MGIDVKQRIIGIMVLIALSVIFIPVIFDHAPNKPAPISLAHKTLKPPTAPQITLTANREIKQVKIAQQKPLETPKSTVKPSLDLPIPSFEKTKSFKQTTLASKNTPNKTPTKAQQNAAVWAVQLGSFSAKKNADQLVNKLQKNGFTAYVKLAPKPHNNVHRVFIGPETDKHHAQDIVKNLNNKMHMKAIVVRYTV